MKPTTLPPSPDVTSRSPARPRVRPGVAAVVALQERRKLCEAMLERARAQNWTYTARDLEAKVRESHEHAEMLRSVLLRGAEFSQGESSALANHLTAQNKATA